MKKIYNLVNWNSKLCVAESLDAPSILKTNSVVNAPKPQRFNVHNPYQITTRILTLTLTVSRTPRS